MKHPSYLIAGVLLACLSLGVSATDDKEEEEKAEVWVENGGFILLIIAVLQMFYALAVVVEEFFVPALNTMCEKYNIPDDVAGATFMAAGASSPELFASFVSLFVTHSTLGVGTIIGSEIFNHLIITAGSIYYCTEHIVAEPRFIGREASFYALALISLLWVLQDTSESSSCYNKLNNEQQRDVNLDTDQEYICMTWYKPMVLVLGYMMYALVCALFDDYLVPFCCPIREMSREEHLHHIRRLEHEIKSTIVIELDLCEQGSLRGSLLDWKDSDKSPLLSDKSKEVTKSEDSDRDVFPKFDKDKTPLLSVSSPTSDTTEEDRSVVKKRTSATSDKSNKSAHSSKSGISSNESKGKKKTPKRTPPSSKVKKVVKVDISNEKRLGSSLDTNKTPSPDRQTRSLSLDNQVASVGRQETKESPVQSIEPLGGVSPTSQTVTEVADLHRPQEQVNNFLQHPSEEVMKMLRDPTENVHKIVRQIPHSKTEFNLAMDHMIRSSQTSSQLSEVPIEEEEEQEKVVEERRESDKKHRMLRGTSLDRASTIGNSSPRGRKITRFHTHHSIREFSQHMMEDSYSALDHFIRFIAPRSLIAGATENLHKMEKKLDGFGCFMWKQSKFFSKIHYNAKAWQLRWVQVDFDGFRSMRHKGNHKGVHWYKAFIVEIVDPKRYIMKIRSKSNEVLFKAQSFEVFKNVLRAISLYQEIYASVLEEKEKQMRLELLVDMQSLKHSSSQGSDSYLHHLHHLDDHKEHEHWVHDRLIDWPEGAVHVFFHVLSFPIKAALYYTVADVRIPGHEGKFGRAIFMSIFYLALFSYIMTSSMELLGPFFGISPFIMGVVFGAAGTSFPNVFASLVVARQGLGNEAISNALGGNVFNIFMGLGVPWFLYCFLGTQDVKNNVYTGLEAGGIIFPTLVLLFFLLVFVIALVLSDWKLFRYHAHAAVLSYLGFLVWVFMTQMLYPDLG